MLFEVFIPNRHILFYILEIPEVLRDYHVTNSMQEVTPNTMTFQRI